MSDRRLRIMQVMRAPVGGLFRHVADLTRALSAMGHEVGIVVDSLVSDPQTEQKLAELARHAGLGIHRMAMPRVLGRADLTTTLKLRKLVDRLGIDVVHGHGAKGGFYARLARRSPRRAVLYTPHGGVLHYSKRSPSGWIFHGLERVLAGRTDAIVFESRFAHKAYEQAIGAPGCKSLVIHNGIGTEEFAPVEVPTDAADFVFVGELRALKGVHLLIPAMAGLQRPDGTPATLVIAGAGADRAALEAQAEGLPVRFVGAMPAREAFALGKTVVIPSLAESLPYIALEAIAAGRPVIASDAGGIGEIFGPAARLVPAGDGAALRQALQMALVAPPDMASVRTRVDSLFRADVMASAIAGLYHDLLAPSAPANAKGATVSSRAPKTT